jgi:hypothetical protein
MRTLPGYLQERQFEIDLDRYHQAQEIMEQIQPMIGMIPLMIAVRRCKQVIDILEEAKNQLEGS